MSSFGDEIVVLDLADGTYFAFGGSVVDIWPALTGAAPVSRIAETFPASPSSGAVEREIQEFASRLVQEGILIAAEAAMNGAGVSIRPVESEFRPISFEKHTDMKDLLTLDPIHDVDPQKGWPHY